MAKHKLERFAENETFGNLFQRSHFDCQNVEFPLRGNWRENYFHNDHPIILELGCGKGEYTIAMAQRNPQCNYIGIDRKGARLWRGCKDALEGKMENVAFLRITIDRIGYYFASGEVDEIWVTFPDPQLQHERRRLVSPRFVGYYRQVMKEGGGALNLKTDSRELYEYVLQTAPEQNWPILTRVDDVYHEPCDAILTEVQTFYEKMWLAQGKRISFVRIGI